MERSSGGDCDPVASSLPMAGKSVLPAPKVVPKTVTPGGVCAKVRIRFEQEKVDEALDALSRSVQEKSDYAPAQNYLGIVLSEKGLRGPAETALRKAIELNPNYAVAHHNLAVVYAGQQPPFIELARYHYNKSRDLGHPADVAIENMLKKANMTRTMKPRLAAKLCTHQVTSAASAPANPTMRKVCRVCSFMTVFI